MEIDLFCGNPDAYVRQRYPFNIGRITTSLIDKLSYITDELGFNKQITTKPENYQSIAELSDLELSVNLGNLFKTGRLVYHLHINKDRRFIEVTLDNRHVDDAVLRGKEEILLKLQKFNTTLNSFLFDQAEKYGLEYFSKLSEIIAPRISYPKS